MTEKALTAPQVAEVLQVSEKTVRRLMRSGALPTIRFGRSVRVSERVLTEWIASGGHVHEDGGNRELQTVAQ